MPSYLVETYLGRGNADARAAGEARARSAAETLSRAGIRIGFDGVIHVPEDEMCFFVFVAGSTDVVARAARLAELDPVRIVEAVTSQSAQRGVDR